MTEPTWTPWLENPSTGECPVPEWAEDYSVEKRDGNQYMSLEVANPAQSRVWKNFGDSLDITHYRYQVPADLAWLAKYVEDFPLNYLMLTTAAYTGAPESVKTGNKYGERDWAKARRDLGYETMDREALGHGFGEPNPTPEEEDPGLHYRGYQYKGIKLDPYRIARIYNMQGGPREQIMKKCLRFTDKGQTEREVVAEIRSALDRWEEMIEEDSQ